MFQPVSLVPIAEVASVGDVSPRQPCRSRPGVSLRLISTAVSVGAADLRADGCRQRGQVTAASCGALQQRRTSIWT
jgi:hypothetical protein